MLQLRCRIDGADRTFPLVGHQVHIGRGPENEVRLADPSVSRRHAVIERTPGTGTSLGGDRPPGLVIRDLGSTNGTRVNGQKLERGPLVPGDALKIGAFDLIVEEVTEAGIPLRAGDPESSPDRFERTLPGEPSAALHLSPSEEVKRVPNASIVRPLRDFASAYGLEKGLEGEKEAPPPPTAGSGPEDSVSPSRSPASPGAVRAAESEVAYGNRVFGFLTRLAQLLITAETVDEVLERVMEIAFEALDVERGFILLQDRDGQPVCELARFGERIEHRPEEGVPVSQTILEAVMEDQVALLTYDAQVDDRLAVGDSIRIHGIRAAMSAPLWSGQGIIGVIQVDSSVQAGAFTERDLDFLTALANYAAVAVERLHHARQIEVERRLRTRFERYHSPSVIEEMLRESETGDIEARGEKESGAAGPAASGVRQLRVTEATVMFADLVGFTAFAERLDPGEVAELLEGYFNHAVEAIFAAGGTLDKFIGDAVMAFFGAPYEQPDHALRAVEAAQRIRRAVREWNRSRREEGLPVLDLRIALNSGPVVVGDVGTARRVDYTVLGNTVNVASRLEQFAARPGEIVVGPETARMVRGEIEIEDLGDMTLKGLEEKVRAYRVVGAP